MGEGDGRRRTPALGDRDLTGELAERYVARVSLAGIVLGVGLVYLALLALWLVTRSLVSVLVAAPTGLLVLVVGGFSQVAAFLYGTREDLPTVRSLRARLRDGSPLSAEDRLLAEALARATAGPRTHPRLVAGLIGGIAAVGVVAVWWGTTGGHPFGVAAHGVFAFAFVVQFLVVTVVARRIGRETSGATPTSGEV